MIFKVSVIIPVYNRVSFLSRAINSVISLKEVGELILIDDGSTDGTFELGQFWCDKYPEKIKLYSHPNKENRGVSLSRNLGILNSKYPFISFLDSDDYYLTNRFENEGEMFLNNSKLDAVFSCSFNERYSKDFNEVYGVKENLNLILDLKRNPLSLYEFKLKKKAILFHTNSITFRRSFLCNKKLFDQRLVLHEDIELWHRLLRGGYFLVNNYMEPVSVISEHEDNSINKKTSDSVLRMLGVLIENIGIDNLYDFELHDIFVRVIREKSKFYKLSFRRRIYFYFNFHFWYFRKKEFLKRFVGVFQFSLINK